MEENGIDVQDIEVKDLPSLPENYPEDGAEEVLGAGEAEDQLAFEVPEDIEEDKVWDRIEVCGIIETLVFMSDKPVALTRIRSAIDERLSLEFLYECISEVQKRYDNELHGIRLVEVGEGFQFRTKPQFSKYVQNYFKVTSLVLTPSALEVLAFIAYKQPISKIELERIRGVDSSHLVRLLIDKRLVKITGRSEEVGRPTLYGTTKEFLEVFNLRNLNELPPEHELESLSSKNELGSISDIKSFISDNNPWRKHETDLNELDALAKSIKSVSTDTDFTKSLKNLKNSKDENDRKKSAFDVLEEFVEKNEIVQQNLEAAQSDLLTTVANAEVKEAEDLYEMDDNLDEEREKLAQQLDQVLDDWGENSSEDKELLNDVDKAFANLADATDKVHDEMVEEGFDPEIKPMSKDQIDDFFKES